MKVNSSTVCVVEDSLAVYTENSMRPEQITVLCDACCKVICRDINVKENIPRDETEAKKPDELFFHGPTPKSVLKAINWIRDTLWHDPGVSVIFLSQARKEHDKCCSHFGEGEKQIRSNATLKRYLLPSLPVTNIHLQVRSKRIGSYFCTMASFQMHSSSKERFLYAVRTRYRESPWSPYGTYSENHTAHILLHVKIRQIQYTGPY